MKQTLSSCLRSVSWGLFAGVPMLFVASMLLSNLWAAILLPCAMVIMVAIIVIDIINKVIFKSEQIIKFLIYSLVGVRTCNLFTCEIGSIIFAILAIIMSFALVIHFTVAWNNLEDEAEKLNP